MDWPEARPILEALRGHVSEAEQEALTCALELVALSERLATASSDAIYGLIQQNIRLQQPQRPDESHGEA